MRKAGPDGIQTPSGFSALSSPHFPAKLRIDVGNRAIGLIDLFGGWPWPSVRQFKQINATIMIRVLRTLAVLAMLPILAFCVFGFIATFEPLSPSTQILWRVIYGLTGLACVGGIVRSLRPRKQGQ